MFTSEDYDDLVALLFDSSYGVIRLDGRGEMRQANPRTMQLLMQINPMSTNFFDTIMPHGAELVDMVKKYKSEMGVIVSGYVINFGVRSKKPGASELIINTTLSKLGDDRFIAIFTENEDDLVPGNS